MALKTRVELSSGIIIEDAFLKVLTISGSKTNMTINLQIYLSEEAYISNKDPVTGTFYSFIPSVLSNSKNTIAQAYEYLKTLPEYANAIDC